MNFVSTHTETCLCLPPMVPLQHSQLKQVHRIELTFGIFVSTVTTYLNVVTRYFCLYIKVFYALYFVSGPVTTRQVTYLISNY
jgi:hypothetical protein